MKTKIAVLGSTGSIGTQTLKILRQFKDEFELVAICANRNYKLLSEQANEFSPRVIAISNKQLADKIELNCQSRVIYGEGFVNKLIDEVDADIYLNAISGVNGLEASFKITKKGKKLALANKESIVSAGELLIDLAKKTGTTILPVDSEHSAIWQCLQGERASSVKKLILTASGGPFFTKTRSELENIRPEDALKHPTWSMGSKISIDSATLMNKGLEVIEASWLFDVKAKDIDVVVHPQSIIHSMVEYMDGAVIAQLGIPDMGQPIQYALCEKERTKTNRKSLNLTEIQSLTFYKPDKKLFKCLQLAYDALAQGKTMPAVLNAANQVAVDRFLANEITFLQIPELIETVMIKHKNVKANNINEIIDIQDKTIRAAQTIKF